MTIIILKVDRPLDKSQARHVPYKAQMKALALYAKKRFKRLKAALKNYAKTGDPELLHNIRVDIKRLKAILNLIKYQEKDFEAHKVFIPLRTLYRACFAVREPLVMEELSSKLPNNAKLQFTPSPKTIRLFKKNIPGYLRLVSAQRKIIDKAIKKVKAKSYSRYLLRKKKIIKEQLTPTFIASELHKTRKIAKEILFLEAMTLKKSERDPFFAAIASSIGIWHDRCVLIESIRSEDTANAQIKTLHYQNIQELKKIRNVIEEYYNRK